MINNVATAISTIYNEMTACGVFAKYAMFAKILTLIFANNLAVVRHFCHFRQICHIRQNRHFQKRSFAISFDILLTIWRLFANSAIFAKIPTFVKSASFKAPLCFVITCSSKFGEFLPFLSIFASACISGHISHINLVTSRNIKKTIKTQTINKQHADTILGNRANYARASSPVERILVYLLWDQVPANVTIRGQKNDFVA